MTTGQTVRNRLALMLLGFGVLAPVLYFGAQLVCGLMTDGYSFLREAASELGRSDRPHHRAFNVAAVATGCSLFAGGFGLLLVDTRFRPPRAANAIVALCCLSAGAAALAAGLYPLPDERHGGGPLGIGLFVAPFAVAFAMRDRVRLRPLLAANIGLFLVGGAIVGRGDAAIAGLGQRLLAAAVFPALAVVCGMTLRAATRRPSDHVMISDVPVTSS